MNKQFLKEALGWGVGIWFIGYVLGIVLFMVLPAALIGWVLTPIGSAIAIWVLMKKVKAKGMKNYVLLGVTWMVIAMVFDYFFLVKVFKPADGYYKADVYVYYFLTFLLPVMVGWWKGRRSK